MQHGPSQVFWKNTGDTVFGAPRRSGQLRTIGQVVDDCRVLYYWETKKHSGYREILSSCIGLVLEQLLVAERPNLQELRQIWSLSHNYFTHEKDIRMLLPIGLEN